MTEKKNEELQKEELDKVNGGFEIEGEVVIVDYKVFKAGDCFESGDGTKFKVAHNYRIPANKPQEIEVYLIGYDNNTHKLSSNYFIFTPEYYKGNNIW